MGSKCLRAWGLRSKTWGLSDLDPYLIANQIREFLKLESKNHLDSSLRNSQI